MSTARLFVSIASILVLLPVASAVSAENPPIIEEALHVEDARVTLPVSAAISENACTLEFVASARENFSNFHFQMGGDHAPYYAMQLEEFVPSTKSAPNMAYRPFERNIDPRLPELKQRTSKGVVLTHSRGRVMTWDLSSSG